MRFAPLLFAGALAAAPAIAQSPSNPSLARPLERLAAEPMLVLPAQYLTFTDSLGWSQQAPSSRSYLGTLDDEITFALTERGLKGRWTLAPDVVRSANRNVTYVADPHSLAAGEVRMGGRRDEWQLSEPLASQLRSLAALTDARYVLFPVEVRFIGGSGKGHALMHLVVIDVRRSQVQWSGDLTGATMTRFSPAIAADLATRLADLIVAPANN